MLSGLGTLSIELTSFCNKQCPMCGRRKIERDYPHLAHWGDMDFALVKALSRELPPGIVIQFHDNGEPLLYPRLGEALDLFPNQIRCFDTNGKLLIERATEIINRMETLSVSIFEGDTEAEEQFEILRQFIELKGRRKPLMIARCLGQIDLARYEKLGCLIARRVFHDPMGSFDYKKSPTIPEIGICLDLLHHLVIKRDGSVSICVRFDPHRLGVIGDYKQILLDNIWNGTARWWIIQAHIEGRREECALCRTCEYWGVPVA